ncbi:hypothetical protein ZWY2020_001295 [Hordeum vulgare]|nr:hypothetical protein ZWY2020_001295 [Hordeum vulgare]
MARSLLATAETEHQVKGGLLLNVVVRQGTAILKLLTSKDETLLVRGNAFLVLDLCLHIVDGVRRLHLQCDGLAREGLYKDLHATTKAEDKTTEPEHQMEVGLCLDVVISQGAAILELLASKDGTLLVSGDALLVVDLGLHVVNGVRGLHLQGDCLAGEGLDDDLHTTTKREHQVEARWTPSGCCSREGASILELLANEEETLLVRGDALLVLDLCLDIVDGVRGLNLKGDGLVGKGLHEDLHL